MSGAGLPVIYFRKGTSGAYASNQCTSGGGSSYSCVINYALVTGGSVTTGDTVQYYVAAQDGAATWLGADYQVMDFAPAPLTLRPGDGPPHIRLDKAAEFLFGDRL